jgi:hypothetical protein
VRTATLLLCWSGLAVVCAILAGCGGSGRAASPEELRLQRSDFVALSRALKDIQVPVASEVAATKQAWPLIANGLHGEAPAAARGPVTAAAQSAARISVPPLLQEGQVVALTGPAAPLAGLVRSYILLATRGWTLIGASIEQIEHGSTASARFARANVALYIESIYDGHFTLAQVGKQLLAGYRKLGGAAAFGVALPEPEIDSLARAFSEANDRLHPHVGTRLGS